MSLFDDKAGLLTEVFGASVTYTPKGGVARQIHSVFRRQPVEAVDPDNHPVLVVSPTWTVPKTLAPEVAAGDRIEPGDDRIYEIQNVWPSGSPAADARVLCELFEVVVE